MSAPNARGPETYMGLDAGFFDGNISEGEIGREESKVQ